MTDDIFQGYKGAALEVLKKYNVRVWGQAVVKPHEANFPARFFRVPKMMTTSTLS